MTTKDKYIKMRNLGKYQTEWFYQYFLENGGQQIDINTFSNLLQFGNSTEIIEHIDQQYGLTRLYNKEGKFLKIVE